MSTRIVFPLLLAAAGVLCSPPGAVASQLIDRDVTKVTLEVNGQGMALLTYVKDGARRRVLASGAINARPPHPDGRQVEFALDYSGGWGTLGTPVWRTFKNVCRPYRGPRLDWLVTACTAPDGTHWAVQSWQRALPNYGLRPKPAQTAWELRLSHFDGELPRLTVYVNWAYRVYDHLFGSLTYKGDPVYGFRATPTGVPLDPFGRNVYVDTFDSAYGRGWRRENSFLVHKGTGVFCYGFYIHGERPSGAGTRYRATVIGPGVTPDVTWEGRPLPGYDKAQDLALHESQREVYGPDQGCRPV